MLTSVYTSSSLKASHKEWHAMDGLHNRADCTGATRLVAHWRAMARIASSLTVAPPHCLGSRVGRDERGEVMSAHLDTSMQPT